MYTPSKPLIDARIDDIRRARRAADAHAPRTEGGRRRNRNRIARARLAARFAH
jgi:hypothetical protein